MVQRLRRSSVSMHILATALPDRCALRRVECRAMKEMGGQSLAETGIAPTALYFFSFLTLALYFFSFLTLRRSTSSHS